MKTLPILLLIFLILAVTALAQDSVIIGGLDGLDPLDTTDRHEVLLALSGGGARGLAAIGILRAFEERQITIRAIAGTSIGSIVGGLYVCGYSPEQLETIIRRTDFTKLFANKPSRLSMFLTQRQERDRHLISARFSGFRPTIPQGLTAGQQLSATLGNLTTEAVYHAGRDFSRFRIPFKAATTDIVSGRMEIMSSGSLSDAMRASMAYPLAFTGLERNEQLLMDGGMMSPVPVDIVSSMGHSGDFIVAVNTTSPLLSLKDLTTPIDIAGQVTTIMTRDKLESELTRADYILAPLPDSIISTDFDLSDSIIAIGYRAGSQSADSIIALLHARENREKFLIQEIDCPNCRSELIQELAGTSVTRHELIRRLSNETVNQMLFRMAVQIDPLEIALDSDREHRAIRLRITAEPSLPLSQLTVNLRGVTRYPDSVLRRHMEMTGTFLSPPVLQRGLDRIVNLYEIDGYDLANIRNVSIDTLSRTVTIDIDEAIVRSISVDGNTTARDWLIRSYSPLQVGKPYSTQKALQGMNNIYGTDLFEQVNIEPIPRPDGVDVQISVREKKSTQIRLGWHWDDEYQSEEFIELLNDNILGVGAEYALRAQYGNDHQLYSAELKANRIMSTYLTGRIQLYYDRFYRPIIGDDNKTTGTRREITDGLCLTVGQQIKRFGLVSAKLRFRNIATREPHARTEQHLGIRQLLFESHVETFDRWPFPHSGKRHYFELAFAGKFIGGDVEFTRWYSSLESYFPIGDWLCYHPILSIGISRAGLPPTEQFYMGGLHSFAGLRTDQRGGDKLFLLNQELRVKLPLRSYVSARFDFGEVYGSTEEITFRSLRKGVSVSLSFDSPIGPIEFGYGVTHKRIDRWYFAAGLRF